MKKFFSLVIPFAFAATSASALDVTTSAAGELAATIGADHATVTTLKVSGPVNAADLKYINDECFALTSLDLSGAVIEAYDGLSINGLTQHPAATISSALFAGTTIRSIVLPTQPLTIGDGAFISSSLESIVLGDNVLSVGMGAFASCPRLTTATINCENVGVSAFNACPQLQTVALNGLTNIAKSTFADCTRLATVTGTADVVNIGADAFRGCTSLAEFTFGEGLKAIGNDAFALSGLTAVNLYNSAELESIGDWAFARIPALTSVVINDNVKSIGQGAFFEDTNLVHYNHPAAATKISSYALTGNESIDPTKLIGENVTDIDRYALANLTQVQTLTLPSTVEYIGDHAMQNMTSLNVLNATEHSVPPTLGEGVWDGVYQPGVTLNVSKNYLEEFKSADQWQDFNIYGTTNVEDTTINDVVVAAVQGRFLGTLLQIQATGNAAISHVQVYDLGGSLLIDAPVGRDFVQIETESCQGNVFIVTVQLADGTKAALKLARK